MIRQQAEVEAAKRGAKRAEDKKNAGWFGGWFGGGSKKKAAKEKGTAENIRKWLRHGGIKQQMKIKKWTKTNVWVGEEAWWQFSRFPRSVCMWIAWRHVKIAKRVTPLVGFRLAICGSGILSSTLIPPKTALLPFSNISVCLSWTLNHEENLRMLFTSSNLQKEKRKGK